MSAWYTVGIGTLRLLSDLSKDKYAGRLVSKDIFLHYEVVESENCGVRCRDLQWAKWLDSTLAM
jgi:hypothetical protein